MDTGEREEIFGQVARLVTTTTRATPLSESTHGPFESVTDAWYIDLDWRISCEARRQLKPHQFSMFRTGAGVVYTSKIEYIELGRREMGLLVRNGQNPPLKATLKMENGNDSFAFRDDTDVTEFKGPINLGLFEIPIDSKLVDHLVGPPLKP